jgi:hypothetical protein
MTWSPLNKIGLFLLALCGVANLVPWPMPPGAQAGPPKSVLIAGVVLGVVAILAVIHAWWKGSKASAWIAIAVSVINAALAVPAFFVDGVPTSIRHLAAIYVAATVVAVALTLAPRRATVG